MDKTSVNGHLYFLTIIDEYSRYKMTYPMKSKGGVSGLLLNFVSRFERQSGQHVKRIHADNGNECVRAFD